MNHGKCINCWWYQAIHGRHFIPTMFGLKEKFGNGKCYMQNSDEGIFTRVEGDSYCPDYLNRGKGDRIQRMTLDEWLKIYGYDS